MIKIKFENIRIIMYLILLAVLILTITEKISIDCYWYKNYGFLCPSCGITRATICISHFQFLDAINFNAFYTLILVPLGLFLIVNDIYVILKRKIHIKDITPRKDLSYVEVILGVKL